jgi:hypothetical protein
MPAGPPIHHFDLYRLDQQQRQQQQQSSLARLDLPSSFAIAVSLIEWPERLTQHDTPQHRLEVRIEALSGSSGGSNGSRQQQQQQQEGQVVPLPPNELLPGMEETAAAILQDEVCESDPESDVYADSRVRRVELRAYGHQWQQRLQQLAATLQQQGQQD